jgi:hypothetical protein
MQSTFAFENSDAPPGQLALFSSGSGALPPRVEPGQARLGTPLVQWDRTEEVASYKTWVLACLFHRSWDEKTQTLTKSRFTQDEVIETIGEYNKQFGKKISPRNAPNLYKDFTRKVHCANNNWPPSVLQYGYTGWGLTGDSEVFEFIPLPPDQTEPFLKFVEDPGDDVLVIPLSTTGIRVEMREHMRGDEASILAVAQQTRMVETHMGVVSPRRHHRPETEAWQQSMKLNGSETDGCYVQYEDAPTGKRIMVALGVEVKSEGEDVMLEQILRQVTTLLDALPAFQLVVPIVLRALGENRFHLVEHEAVGRDKPLGRRPLQKISEAVYRLSPTLASF